MICHNDDVAETVRLYELAMLEHHPPHWSEHVRQIKALALSRGWTVHPEPGALRLVDKSGTARAYVAFDNGPGYIEWASSGDGQLVSMATAPHTVHPGIMWLYVRDWFEQLPQAIKPAMENTGQLDGLPHRERGDTSCCFGTG